PCVLANGQVGWDGDLSAYLGAHHGRELLPADRHRAHRARRERAGQFLLGGVRGQCLRVDRPAGREGGGIAGHYGFSVTMCSVNHSKGTPNCLRTRTVAVFVTAVFSGKSSRHVKWISGEVTSRKMANPFSKSSRVLKRTNSMRLRWRGGISSGF